MRSYIAKSKESAFSGGWFACLSWSMKQAMDDPYLVLKIHRVRPGERYGRIVAEVAVDGVRLIDGGRHIKTKELLEAMHGYR